MSSMPLLCNCVLSNRKDRLIIVVRLRCLCRLSGSPWVKAPRRLASVVTCASTLLIGPSVPHVLLTWLRLSSRCNAVSRTCRVARGRPTLRVSVVDTRFSVVSPVDRIKLLRVACRLWACLLISRLSLLWSCRCTPVRC